MGGCGTCATASRSWASCTPAAWRREHRPYWLGNVTARYDLSAQRWGDRIDRMEAARRQWSRTGRLPPPAEVGIPTSPPAAATLSAEPDI